MNAVIFPGQGVQYSGMGKEIYDSFPCARKVFLRIDELLGREISSLCFFGKRKLNDLQNQQLAILSVSLAAYEVFKEKKIPADLFSGLSLGEYICLYPAGVLTLEELVYLVKKRAEVTAKALKDYPASLLVVIGLERSCLEEISKKEKFYLANINSPRQTVIAVKNSDKQKIKGLLEAAGASTLKVNTKGGFHSPLMKAAAESLRKYTERIRFRRPKVPIVSNFTAKPTKDRDEIKENIIAQLSHPVLWQRCVEGMVDAGVERFFEVGPAQVLRGLVKDTSPQATVINLEKKDDFDKLSSLS